MNLIPNTELDQDYVGSEEGRPTCLLIIQDMDPGEDGGYDRRKPQGYENE